MAVFDTLTTKASRLATDVQSSLRRARLEGERRLLQRQHRAALEELGERVYELHQEGAVSSENLVKELAVVEGKLMEIEAKVSEIDALRPDDEDAPPPGDAASTAFPMVDDDSPNGTPSAGPGWEQADRFFRS